MTDSTLSCSFIHSLTVFRLAHGYFHPIHRKTAAITEGRSPNETSNAQPSGSSSSNVFGRLLNTLRPPLNRTYTAQSGGIRSSNRSAKRRNSSPPPRPGSSQRSPSDGSGSGKNSPNASFSSPPPSASAGMRSSPNLNNMAQSNNQDDTSFSERGSVNSTSRMASPLQQQSQAFPSGASGSASTSNSPPSVGSSATSNLAVRPQPERRQSSSKRLAAAIRKPLFRRSSSQSAGVVQSQLSASTASIASASGSNTTATTGKAFRGGASSAGGSGSTGPPSPGPSVFNGRRPFTSSSSRSNYSLAAQSSTPSPGTETLHNSAGFPSPFFAQATPTNAYPNPFSSSPPIDCASALNTLLSRPITSTLSQLIPLNLIAPSSGFNPHAHGLGNLPGASSISVATSAISEAATTSSAHNTATSSTTTTQTPSSSTNWNSLASTAGGIGGLPTSAFVSNEQLAASSLNLPTTSIGTIWRIARAFEWISENGPALNALAGSRANPLTPKPMSGSARPSLEEMRKKHEEEEEVRSAMSSSFDFSALVQSVLDVMASTAAEAHVDLVYFHGSKQQQQQNVGGQSNSSGQRQNTPQYMYENQDIQEAFVKGDERGLGIGLLAVLKQILADSRPGASIEIGLSFALTLPPKESGKRKGKMAADLNSGDESEDDEDDEEYGPPLGTYLCAIELVHNYGGSAPSPTLSQSNPATSSSSKALDSTVSAALLQYLRLSLVTLPPRSECQVYKLTCTLPQARHPNSLLSSAADATRRRRKSIEQNKESSLQDLMRFVDTSLRGKKVAFHAQESSEFAQHTSHHLASWGMDVNHISLIHEDEGWEPHSARSRVAALRPEDRGHLGRLDSGFGGSDGQSPPQIMGLASPAVHMTSDPMASFGQMASGTSPSSAGQRLGASEFSSSSSSHPGSTATSPPLDPTLNFIIVDDDIATLKRQLISVRNNAPTVQLQNALLAKRPQLQSRRTRSSQAIQRVTQTAISIIYFTSLTHYRQIKEVVHNILKSASPMFPLPEVLVIPKPVGPRRLLATLFNAVKRPTLDPYFVPIATSPSSPGGHYFFAGGRPSPAPSHTNDFDIAAGQAVAAQRQQQLHLQAQHQHEMAGLSAGVSQISIPKTPPVPGDSNPPSPVSPDALEYFSKSAAELGSSASQGIIIQSPDGRPTGLFFQPRAASMHERAESMRMARNSVSDGDRGSIGSASARQVAKSSPALGGGPAGFTTAGGTELPAIMIPDNMDIGTSGRAFTRSPTSASPDNTSFGQRLEGLAVIPTNPAPKMQQQPTQQSTNTPSSSSLDFPAPYANSSDDSLNQQAGPSNDKPGSPTLAQQDSATPRVTSPPRSSASSPPARPLMSRQATIAAGLSPAKAPPASLGLGTAASSSTSPTSVISKEAVVSPTVPLTRTKTDRKSSGRADKPKKTSRRPTGTVVPPINVLIVEDNPINQIILSTFLRRKGIKYSVANNGQEAVDSWKTGGFHLVLMDIQLPVKDGIEATQEIRAMERANNMPGFMSTPTSEGPTPIGSPSASNVSSPFELPVIIVALTASDLQSDRVKALAAGCNDFLTKPVSLQWLNQKLVEWGSMAYLSGFSGKRRATLMSPDAGLSAKVTSAMSAQGKELKAREVEKQLAKVKQETKDAEEEKTKVVEERAEVAARQEEDALDTATEAKTLEEGNVPELGPEEVTMAESAAGTDTQ